jgi:hypothetical protein
VREPDIERAPPPGGTPEDFAMLTPSTPIATPAYDSTPTAKAAAVEASARADVRQQAQAGTRNDAQLAELAASRRAARDAASEVPDPMISLSTIAVAGAMSSVPAALEMMRSIALQSAAGTLSDTDRQTLHAEYAQLTAHVATTVGSVGAGEQPQASAGGDEPRDDAGSSGHGSGGDRRGALAQAAAPQPAQAQAAEPAATTQQPTPATEPAPHADIRAQALHVGTDAYEPVPLHPSLAQPTATAHPASAETETGTQRTQAAQAAQFEQVARTAQAAPVVAVA